MSVNRHRPLLILPQKFDTNFRKFQFFPPRSPINSSTYGGFLSLDKKHL